MKRYIYILAMVSWIMQGTPLLATYETEEEFSELETTRSHRKLAYLIGGGIAVVVTSVGLYYLLRGSSGEGPIQEYKVWCQNNNDPKEIKEDFGQLFSKFMREKATNKEYDKDNWANWRTWIDKKEGDVLADLARFLKEMGVNITEEVSSNSASSKTPFLFVILLDFLTDNRPVIEVAFALNHLFHLLEEIAPGEAKKAIKKSNQIVKFVFDSHRYVYDDSTIVNGMVDKNRHDKVNLKSNMEPIIQVLLSHGLDPETTVTGTKHTFKAYANALTYKSSKSSTYSRSCALSLYIKKQSGKWEVS
ncbi:MAG: hypothetical protein AAF335_00530 [Bacteroidota bacterium]